MSNAGISLHEGSFKNVTESGFDAQFKVNFKAPYFLAKYFVEKIENEKIDFANILFVTSERGSFCTSIPYGLTKASLKNYVGALCRYYCFNERIRVNAIAPGVTSSEMTGYSENGDFQTDDSPNAVYFIRQKWLMLLASYSVMKHRVLVERLFIVILGDIRV